MPTDQEVFDLALAELSVAPISALRDGGQKRVWLVSRESGEGVLKVVRIGSSSSESLVRAHREVALLNEIRSPHVVKVVADLVELGDPVFAVAWLEEYLDGDDLADCVSSPWAADEVRRLGIEVSAGLSELHDRERVHRDLSARNIRRKADGTFVVMDPGFARHLAMPAITVGGQPGTRGFMTPEHVLGATGPIPASDVFAVGTLMYLAATTHLPFAWIDDDIDYIRRLISGRYVPLATARPDLPQTLANAVARSLHAQSARRPRNGRELKNLLERSF